MISPRETRLFRLPDLRSLHRQLVESAWHNDVASARATAVIVPTRAAGAELRRTLENLLLGSAATTAAAFALPEIATRVEWYELMHERLGTAPAMLSMLEREVLFRAATRDAADAGCVPPFRLRPGLVVEILALYDALRRNHRTVEAFERLLVESLEPSAGVDRGAARLLKQTRFLAEAFRAYEGRVADTGLFDEHALREHLVGHPSMRPFRHLIVTVGDSVAEPAGLWPADFDLLSRLPGLERIDIVATEAMLGAGLQDRIHEMLPGIEDVRVPHASCVRPVLVVPGDSRQRGNAGSDRLFFVSRDREDELVAVARSVKAAAALAPERSIGDRMGVVFQHPLPYLYLAQQVLAAAGVPYQAFDALPLAAEPYAAAFDLVCEFVTSDFSRQSVVALLRSPHFAFQSGGQPIGSPAVTALDRMLREVRFLGGRRQLAELADEWSTGARDAGASGRLLDERQLAAAAARAACEAADELDALERQAPPSVLLDALLAFLKRHERHTDRTDAALERHLRARAAVINAVDNLREASVRYDPRPCTFAEVAATIRYWMEQQTFTPRTGTDGLRLVGADAARYGDFDEVRIVGVVDGDWPERSGHNIFYSSSLLQQLGWSTDAARVRAARAAFGDLLLLPATRVSVSVFTLEDDALVGPSPLVDDLCAMGLQVEEERAMESGRIFTHEALSEDPVAPQAVAATNAARWLTLRLGRSPATLPLFHGSIGSYRPTTCSVSAVERYIECPFRYFAADVLRLPEEPDEEALLTQLERGRFVHEVFRAFFSAWHESGHGAIDDVNFGEAQQMFARVAEAQIDRLPERDRPLERARLFGSEAAMGLAERLFRLEIALRTEVVERLLEFEFAGEFDFAAGDAQRRLKIRGAIDRIDLLPDNTLRLIDYKIGRAPNRAHAVQLPVYGVCAVQELERRRGTRYELRDAGYAAFGERRLFVPLAKKGVGLVEALADGQARFLAALDEIERGDFPPRPRESVICSSCAYPAVCRKDYVGD